MKRFASTRSENFARQPAAGRAQCNDGSIDEDGMRYGLTTHALIASTAPTATTIVTTQSITVGQGWGGPSVMRSTGPLTKAFFPCCARAATLRCARGLLREAPQGQPSP